MHGNSFDTHTHTRTAETMNRELGLSTANESDVYVKVPYEYLPVNRYTIHVRQRVAK